MAAADPRAVAPAQPRAERIRRHPWLAILGPAVRTPRGATGLGLVCLVVAIAVVGPFVAPHPPDALVTLTFGKPSGQFPLGGDFLGRDVLSRVLDGGWLLLLMAVAATAIGIAAGAAAGISAAYLRGRTDGLIMRTVDVILAFPQLVFALLLLSILGPKLWLIVLAVGLTHAPAVARVLRSATLDISERDYVKVAELQGMRPAAVMTKEILPSLSTPLMVEAGLRLTYSIIIMAGLAFLGFGQPPPAPSWGIMINENRAGLPLNPWAVIVPATVIALLDHRHEPPDRRDRPGGARCGPQAAGGGARGRPGPDREQGGVSADGGPATITGNGAGGSASGFPAGRPRARDPARLPGAPGGERGLFRGTARVTCLAWSVSPGRGRPRSPSPCWATPGVACPSAAARSAWTGWTCCGRGPASCGSFGGPRSATCRKTRRRR